jgi:2',3'-cyclic-nucleotide 2'-phosphodiesterase
MNILYIGDIMGEPGIEAVKKTLPDLKKSKNIDLVIAQGENVSEGKGLLPADMKRLQEKGVDFFSGGNHTIKRDELIPVLEDDAQPVIAPANIVGVHGKGWKYIDTAKGPVLVISILGETVGSSSRIPITNALLCIDEILEQNKKTKRVATVVNIHGDFSSEKVVFGYYLDGKVSAVIGDHWHVPTADAMVLPKGTAHMTDVGMCGALHSSLGVKLDIITKRWHDSVVNKNELELDGPLQFSALLVTVDESSGLSTEVEHVYTTAIS